MPTRNHQIAAVIGAIGVALSGCAAIATHGGGDIPGAVGIPYLLPKTLFEIRLAGTRENITLEVRPFYVGDPAAGQFTLSHRLSPLSSDTVTFTPDARGLLTSLDASMDSRAVETFGHLGTVAGQFQSADDTRYITRIVVDPADESDLRDASAQMTAAIRAWTQASGCTGGRDPFCDMGAASFALEWAGETTASSSSAARAPSARGPGYVSGVYVRAPRPGRLNVWRCSQLAACSPRGSGSVLAGAFHIDVPNGAPPSLIPLNGGLFADRTHDLRLTNGMVTHYRLISQSEAEGLGTAAVGFLAAQVRAASEALQSDISRTRAEATLAQEQTNLAQRQAELAGAMHTLQQAREGHFPEPSTQAASEAEAADAGGAEKSNGEEGQRPAAPGQGAASGGSPPTDGLERSAEPSVEERIWSVFLFPAPPDADD